MSAYPGTNARAWLFVFHLTQLAVLKHTSVYNLAVGGKDF
jgi:hypothetical protein